MDNHDPLAPSVEPSWLKVFDSLFKELSRRELLPNQDLRAELQREADSWAADGWEIEGAGGLSFQGMFFMNRGGERRMVAIMPRAEPLSLRPASTG